MKIRRKITVLTLLACFILFSSFFYSEFWMKLLTKNSQSTDKNDYKLKVARYWVLSNKIHIDDNNPSLNWATTSANNDWCTGSGTWSDPYNITNVVIDGQETESCIFIENSNEPFIIENCTLFNSGDEGKYSEEAGIKLVYTSNGTIIQNNCSRNDAYGIILNNCENNTLSANTVNDNIYTGIYLETTCINNTIKGNDVRDNNNNGIYLQTNCDFIKILQNTVHDNDESGIVVEGGHNNTISNNLVYNNEHYGIFVKYTINNTITANQMIKCGIGVEGSVAEISANIIDKENKVNGRTVYFYINKTNLDTADFLGFGPPGQIILAQCKNSVITNFNLSQTSVGISLFNCRNNNISNIIANNCTKYGIYLTQCDNITIKENSVNNNEFGIELIEVNNAIINRNNLTNNIAGIYLFNSTFNIFSQNNFSFNTAEGIILDACEKNNITQNFACSNTVAGINLMGSNFNLISNNSASNNINALSFNLGIGIQLQWSNNNTISRNVLSNNSYAGITFRESKNSTFIQNNLTNCGLHFTYEAGPTIEDYISHSIDESNLVNGKVLYYKKNKENLKSNDFPKPGQIILVNCTGTQISNLNISQTTAAISLFYCTYGKLSSNNFTENTYCGIYLIQSSNTTVSSNNVSGNFNKFINLSNSFGFGVGISIKYCFNITVLNNNASQNGMGIDIENSKENNISDNILYDNYLGGIFIGQGQPGSCDNNNLSGNIMRNCGLYLAISPFEPVLFIDKTNLVNGNPLYYYYHKNNLNPNNFTDAGQVVLSGCTNSIISNLNLSKCSLGINLLHCTNISVYNVNSSINTIYGFGLGFSNNCNILNCSASQNWLGIYDLAGINNTFIGNKMKNSNKILMEGGYFGGGIVSFSSTYGTIAENILNDNLIGLMIQSGLFHNISNNVIDNNNQYGIILSGCSNSTFIRNSITNNDLGFFIQNIYSENNSIYYNHFIGNRLQAQDNGDNNAWDDGFAGNYWDDYSGLDADNNGIGDSPYSIRGLAYNKDNYPLLYLIDVDTDGDGFKNLEEYALGRDNYRTNVLRPDTDYDELSDYWEWKNSTNPLNNDTDYDKMPDGWEVFNFLNATNGIDNLTDADNDFLLNLYEYLNGTDPNNEDSDGDTFLDGIEASAIYNWWTDPLDKWWYPMPNLNIIDFRATTVDIGKPFVLNFTITNDGIWEVENVTIIIWVEYLGLALYNSTIDEDEPINLEVDEIYQDLIQSELLTTAGGLVMELILDPDNLINETYSSENGTLRVNSERDNSLKTQLEITGELPGNGEGIDPLIIILIAIGAVAFAGIISAYVIIRPRIKKRAVFKKQIENAKKDIDNFEFNTRSFIRTKLKDTYESVWWDAGIPEYIRTTIGTKLKTEKPKKLAFQVDKMDLLDFTHYSSIITYQENWDQIFSKTFPNKSEIETNFENLRLIKRNLNEGTITREQLSTYPLFIHTIRNYFTKGFNVFLSYSTLDTELFNVREIAKRLESYPLIDRIFFWEEDSGENIVTYMERTLAITKVFVFFCTEHSVRSKAVEDEWQAAFQMRKKGLMKIVPVYENEDIIPFLLMPLLNVKFIKDDFAGFIQKLYEEIIR